MLKKISKHIEEQIIDFYQNSNLSVSKIAKKYSVHRVTVYNVLKRNNIIFFNTKFKKDKLNVLKKIAKEKGGELLSKEYLGARKKHQWKCYNGHVFETSPRMVLEKKWCSQCSSGLHENLCRYAFEILFDKKFPKYKPKWLISEKKYQMELDGYCAELNLAFEHHGIQHYKENKFFNIQNSTFEYRKQCDQLKKTLCEQHGINLIIIPALNILLKLEELKPFIINECKNLNIDIIDKEINYNNAYKNTFKKTQYGRIKKIIKNNNAILLSGDYVTCQSVFKIKCNNCLHVGERNGNRIITDGFTCSFCRGKNFFKKNNEIINMYKIKKNISFISRELKISRKYIKRLLEQNNYK